MKTFLVFVSTVDGKITRWGDPLVRKWSSKEDQEYFSGLIQKCRLVVLGSNTYSADPIRPRENRLLIVLTGKPERYKGLGVPGQLEFIDESPSRLKEIYKNKGYSEMLVAGGPRVATSFLKENLIDEIWLT
ncbi:MAG TPA: dihydrofolate reductase family protein, partial [Bacteroidales bacterium]|nr:dihydrofolate reductase family protein [Bacteroidales bacterium]